MKLLCLLFVLISAIYVFAVPVPQTDDAKCQTFCPFNYAPVCGTVGSENAQTFGNECALKSHACSSGLKYTLVQGEC